ncbi:MAG: hypothetical protein HQ515_06915 [Phycisphaeraceae bacterium]|nr:hypothetical protein [Phycisphaeraceae bacterium]
MNRFRDTIICSVCVLIAAGFFFVAGRQLDAINAQRHDMKLIINQPLENAPPSLAFATVAMGAFRGLVVDILWMRADKLKDEGKFFDAKQLAEWISILQPRFATVWEFHAWNMAYNISVAIPASQPAQRWQWVRNGYELLRDKGIPYNPKALLLYRELARIFQHKIGAISDDAHKYYKIQFAREIGPIVGRATDEDFVRAMTAPTTWDALLLDPNMAEFTESLQEADPAFTEGEAFVKSYMALRENPARFAPDANSVIEDYMRSETLYSFGVFARAYLLKKIWKMDVGFMHEMNVKFGPINFEDPNIVLSLDWRHPDVHALYWASLGLKLGADEEGRELSSTEVNTDRIIIHSLQNLFRYGKIHFYTVQYYPTLEDGTESTEPRYMTDAFLRPDLRMFDRYNDAAKALLKKYEGDDGRVDSLGTGYRNMLKNAILSFYQARLTGQAARIYKILQDTFPRPEFTVPLEEFARNRFLEEIRETFGIHDAREQIESLLKESYYLFAIHSDDEAYGRQELATQLHDFYMAEYGDEETRRVDLPPMTELHLLSMQSFLEDQNYPPYLKENYLARMKLQQPEAFEVFQQWMEEQQAGKISSTPPPEK